MVWVLGWGHIEACSRVPGRGFVVLARCDPEDRVEGFPGGDDLGLLRGHGGQLWGRWGWADGR